MNCCTLLPSVNKHVHIVTGDSHHHKWHEELQNPEPLHLKVRAGVRVAVRVRDMATVMVKGACFHTPTHSALTLNECTRLTSLYLVGC